MKRLVLLIIMLVALVSFAQAQKEKPLRVGVVDVEKIVKEIPEALEADKKLQTITVAFRDSLNTIEKNFVERAEKYQKQKTMMTADQQKVEEESLQKIQIEYQKFQQEKFGNQGEIAQLREELLAPIREKVREAIKRVAVKEGMSFVFDKTNPTLLYAEDAFDITLAVMDNIKRGK